MRFDVIELPVCTLPSPTTHTHTNRRKARAESCFLGALLTDSSLPGLPREQLFHASLASCPAGSMQPPVSKGREKPGTRAFHLGPLQSPPWLPPRCVKGGSPNCGDLFGMEDWVDEGAWAVQLHTPRSYPILCHLGALWPEASDLTVSRPRFLHL